MRKYKWRTDLPSDIVAGLTVGIMQLPQGIGNILGFFDKNRFLKRPHILFDFHEHFPEYFCVNNLALLDNRSS